MALSKLVYFLTLSVGMFCWSATSIAGDQLGDMTISHCSSKVCVRVSTDRGYQSPLNTQVTSFDAGKLDLYEKGDGMDANSSVQFVFAEGYIDLESLVVIVKGLKNSIHKDALIHLLTGQIDYF